MLTLRRLALTLFVLPLFGCPELGTQEREIVAELPENPTWTEHIKPLMDTYCNECHSVPPQQLAPPTLRLDTCEDVGGVFGAKNQSIRIIFRTIDQVPSPMPPTTYGIYPTADEQEIIQRWVDQGANCDGAPTNVNPNNMTGDMGVPPNMNPGDMAMPNNMSMDMGMDTGMDMDMDTGPDLPPAATWNQVASMMITPCTGCHSAGAGGLQWSNVAELRTAIEGMNSPTDDLAYIEPNQPELSHLFLRVSSVDMAFRMPRNSAQPIDNLVMAMESWINNGADFDN